MKLNERYHSKEAGNHYLSCNMKKKTVWISLINFVIIR